MLPDVRIVEVELERPAIGPCRRSRHLAYLRRRRLLRPWQMPYCRALLDEVNISHVTRHGVAEAEVLRAFASSPRIRKNKRNQTSGYSLFANGIRVNFVYNFGSGVARPISAWRI